MTVFAQPSDVAAPVREAGGDNEVPRDSSGRPKIKVWCDRCEDILLSDFVALTGKVVSPKTGKPIQCPKCNGAGKVERSYTRTTTYIDVLDDKTNLQAWGERMVLIGVARDPKLLDDVLALDESREEKESKDALNRKAKVAKLKAGAEEKADKGTALHGLSELVDQGLPLPRGISFGDVIDMDAYRRSTEGFRIVHMEKLVVHDELRIGGTPDRVSRWVDERPLIAPDGVEIKPDEYLITDLKTGTVEYGALKMAMQLAIYSRSELYDPKTGERTPLGNVNQKWGVIMNVPAGSGEATLYWADLELGWRAVEVATLVREMRSSGSKKALVPVTFAR